MPNTFLSLHANHKAEAQTFAMGKSGCPHLNPVIQFSIINPGQSTFLSSLVCCNMKYIASLNQVFLPKMLDLNPIKPLDLISSLRELEEPVKQQSQGDKWINQECETFYKTTGFIEDKI